MSDLRIDIVLPCYNPQEGWANNIIQRVAELKSHLDGCELKCIVVNDGSTRNVTEVDVASLKASMDSLRWIHNRENRGKGHALRCGVAESDAPIVLYTDIDLPYEIDSMLKCIQAVSSDGCDVALAVRNQSYYSKLPVSRRWISKILRSMNKVLLRIPTSDTQGGLKVFNRSGREHFLRTTIDRYLFDLEFIRFCARDASIRICPIESNLREGIVFTQVRMSILLSESTNFLKVLLRRD